MGTFGSAPVGGGDADASGQGAQSGIRPVSNAVPESKGRKSLRGCAFSAAWASAKRVLAGADALPRERELLAGRRGEQDFVDLLRALGARDAGQVRDQPLREEVQPQERVRVVAQRRADGCGQQRAQRRVQVARLQDLEQTALAQAGGVASAGAVVDGAEQRVPAQPGGEPREFGRAGSR